MPACGTCACVIYLRNYSLESLDKAQDDWKVETRLRLSGKAKGTQYKCFRAPDGGVYWSIKKAVEAGFKGYLDGSNPDGRTKRKKNAAAKTVQPTTRLVRKTTLKPKGKKPLRRKASKKLGK